MEGMAALCWTLEGTSIETLLGVVAFAGEGGNGASCLATISGSWATSMLLSDAAIVAASTSTRNEEVLVGVILKSLRE